MAWYLVTHMDDFNFNLYTSTALWFVIFFHPSLPYMYVHTSSSLTSIFSFRLERATKNNLYTYKNVFQEK